MSNLKHLRHFICDMNASKRLFRAFHVYLSNILFTRLVDISKMLIRKFLTGGKICERK